jgi:hypothetical protein
MKWEGSGLPLKDEYFLKSFLQAHKNSFSSSTLLVLCMPHPHAQVSLRKFIFNTLEDCNNSDKLLLGERLSNRTHPPMSECPSPAWVSKTNGVCFQVAYVSFSLFCLYKLFFPSIVLHTVVPIFPLQSSAIPK